MTWPEPKRWPVLYMQGEHFLCGECAVECFGRIEAGVAVVTCLAVITKIFEQDLAAAVGGFTVAKQGGEFLVLDALLFFGGIGVVYHTALEGDVLPCRKPSMQWRGDRHGLRGLFLGSRLRCFWEGLGVRRSGRLVY